MVVRRMEASSVWISAQHWVLEVSPHGGYLSPFLTPPRSIPRNIFFMAELLHICVSNFYPFTSNTEMALQAKPPCAHV